MARLSHPNVVGVYDVGVCEGRVFLAMEYVDGVPFDRWLGDREHPWTDTLDVVIAAAHGLDAAHRNGVVHGDLTPSNILVGRDGRVRVTDFGLARSLPRALDERTLLHAAGDRADSSAPTRIGEEPAPVGGTLRYLAPEQLRGRRGDERSDQFAFAVVLYEALYRQHPFAANEPSAFVTRVRLGTLEPPPPASGVPKFIFRALRRALSVNPDERYPSIEALVDALTLREPTTRTAHERGWIGLVARALALVAIGFTVGGAAAAVRAHLHRAAAPAISSAITAPSK
jgi:serine/threonine protein kinase